MSTYGEGTLYSGLETEEMKRAGCSLLLQPGVEREPIVKVLKPCRVVVTQDRGADKNVLFRGCTVLQLHPKHDPNKAAFPQIFTIAGPCRYTPQDKKDFEIMMRTYEQSRAMRLPPNGDMDWPDYRAFETCPCCSNRATPGDEEYWMLFHPLLQAAAAGMGIRTICRLTCQECFEDLVDGMVIEATVLGSSSPPLVQQFSIMDVVEDQGPITWLERGGGMGRRDGEAMEAYFLYTAWEATGAWQALSNSFAESLQDAFGAGGYNVKIQVGSKDGYRGKEDGGSNNVDELPKWIMKRASKVGKRCDGPGCERVHGDRLEAKNGKKKKVRLKECSGCLIRLYCTTDCQTKAWPQHKAECKAKQEQAKREAAERKAKEEKEKEAKMEEVLASFVPLSVVPQGGGGKKKKKGGGGKGKKKKGKK